MGAANEADATEGDDATPGMHLKRSSMLWSIKKQQQGQQQQQDQQQQDQQQQDQVQRPEPVSGQRPICAGRPRPPYDLGMQRPEAELEVAGGAIGVGAGAPGQRPVCGRHRHRRRRAAASTLAARDTERSPPPRRDRDWN
ncbi:hypothetical protein PLESTB_000372700 [Pleodorina starrii]|uniref:Uncharacterized protein n=1 Tax=Pleodorina starrii TaxID=330485 RepID=A0A9W6BDX9_9CHLO|nr:hypothetical protein PLESTM_000022200 [Pleodorina starrii]GLC50379.1 hypothetical protein PLESTB_000372700 [Pleodorina starrii]